MRIWLWLLIFVTVGCAGGSSNDGTPVNSYVVIPWRIKDDAHLLYNTDAQGMHSIISIAIPQLPAANVAPTKIYVMKFSQTKPLLSVEDSTKFVKKDAFFSILLDLSSLPIGEALTPDDLNVAINAFVEGNAYIKVVWSNGSTEAGFGGAMKASLQPGTYKINNFDVVPNYAKSSVQIDLTRSSYSFNFLFSNLNSLGNPPTLTSAILKGKNAFIPDEYDFVKTARAPGDLSGLLLQGNTGVPTDNLSDFHVIRDFAYAAEHGNLELELYFGPKSVVVPITVANSLPPTERK